MLGSSTNTPHHHHQARPRYPPMHTHIDACMHACAQDAMARGVRAVVRALAASEERGQQRLALALEAVLERHGLARGHLAVQEVLQVHHLELV